ncbi:type I-E CRISPR-associated protein Cas5/CasD [Nocardia brasiliensis]|uniref:type I-E CRISPR-associated protein Cas5/CasD n=1 Tax=Nocardia brasiliensis TaxID=37326 RepID=UPI00245901CF|nr:type I-E CRISPR-associated protein Cas5/CasD [Nocardia brasiliensis]
MPEAAVRLTRACLVLRLAGPLQSWGAQSRHNRRDTATEPTKSGVVGLLAAALGRERGADIADLAALRVGVRTDEPGILLRDFHTVSDFRGRPLLAAAVNSRGAQKNSMVAGVPKHHHVTRRFYLQDAVFVVALGGSPRLLDTLWHAVRRPAYPLALGRRSCPPTLPLVLAAPEGALWTGAPEAVLTRVPWQPCRYRRWTEEHPASTHQVLPVVVDDPLGTEIRGDLPVSFASQGRRFEARRVRRRLVVAPTLIKGAVAAAPPPDWFTLLD